MKMGCDLSRCRGKCDVLNRLRTAVCAYATRPGLVRIQFPLLTERFAALGKQLRAEFPAGVLIRQP